MPSRNDNDDVSTLLQRIKEDVSTIVNTLENRFLYLITERGRGGIPSEDVAGELSPLMRDLRVCFRRVVEIEEREDLNFRAVRDLHEIDRHCLWLFRKIRVQQIFIRKLSLEAKLRSLIPPEAFSIYQAVLDLDAEQRESAASDDATIHALMLQDTEQ